MAPAGPHRTGDPVPAFRPGPAQDRGPGLFIRYRTGDLVSWRLSETLVPGPGPCVAWLSMDMGRPHFSTNGDPELGTPVPGPWLLPMRSAHIQVCVPSGSGASSCPCSSKFENRRSQAQRQKARSRARYADPGLPVGSLEGSRSDGDQRHGARRRHAAPKMLPHGS